MQSQIRDSRFRNGQCTFFVGQGCNYPCFPKLLGIQVKQLIYKSQCLDTGSVLFSVLTQRPTSSLLLQTTIITLPRLKVNINSALQ